MAGYLDWALEKLRGAPAGACAFWIDINQLMGARNHGGLADTELQRVSGPDGLDWQVVRFRANPFPARHALSDPAQRTVVWCVGMPNSEAVDITAFEDFFGRTMAILDISLTAFADERVPGVEIPASLGSRIAPIEVDLDRYLHLLRDLHAHVPLNSFSAINALAGLLANRESVVVASDAANALASVASALAAADSANTVTAIYLAVSVAAEGNLKLKPLLEELAKQEPHDVLSLVYVASGLARQSVANVGSVLVADGWLSPSLRSAFEKADGRWEALAALIDGMDLGALAARVESTLNTAQVGRLRDVLTAAKAPVGAAVDEPLPGIRLAALLARFQEFSQLGVRAKGPGRVTQHWSEELNALDLVADGLRSGQGLQLAVSEERDVVAYAESFLRSAASSAHLSIGRAKVAFRSVETLLSPSEARRVSTGLDSATDRANACIDLWDQGWRDILSRDVSGFLSHPRQGWRMSRDFAGGGTKKVSWLLVFDGLRYDLWREILVPALRHAGWKADGSDVSFAFLPSVTEVSRRTVIGGSPEAARGQEEVRARALAERAQTELTYLVRTEVSEKQLDEVQGWNVRVFSLPDKLVHSDIADLGTLAAQFEKWVQDELIGWVRRNIKPDTRFAVSTDHGFAELSDESAIDVPSSSGEERNVPRVVADALELGAFGLHVPDATRQTTVATSRRWFRTPGARRWRFAHGGSTLHEVVVPFAELTPVKEGAAIFEVNGLPASIELEEGAGFSMDFKVTVSGGAEMFPSVTVTGLTQLVKKSLQRGEQTAVNVTLNGEEGLDRIFIRLQSGSERHDVIVPVTVKLAKVKRASLDFDI